MNAQPTLARLSARQSGRGRRGLSVLEFLGCLIALVGGIWLGAVYLGVDVRHIAYVALADAQLLEKVPEKWRPVEPVSENAPSQKELTESVKHELVALRQEITSLRTSQQAPAPSATATAPVAAGATLAATAADANEVSKEASLEYWTRLNDVVKSQAALQMDSERAATEGNATKVAALKGRISRFSASAIRALPTTNVDPSAAKFGRDLADWYEQAAVQFEQAVQIWESPTRGQGSPEITKEWEQGLVQHQNEGRLLADRAAAVRDGLTRQFGAEFVPLAAL